MTLQAAQGRLVYVSRGDLDICSGGHFKPPANMRSTSVTGINLRPQNLIVRIWF